MTATVREPSSGRMTAERKTTTIATLNESLRLVAVQFMMPNNRIPQGIPPKPVSTKPPMAPVPGVEVLESTSDTYLFPLLDGIAGSLDYELVSAWKHPHESDWRVSVVRFMYCRKGYVENLCPDFVARRNERTMILAGLVSYNLWTVQGHLNPYCESDGSRTGTDVLMLGCVRRNPLYKANGEPITVFKGGRDPLTKHGIGPMVLLSTISSKLLLIGGKVLAELR